MTWHAHGNPSCVTSQVDTATGPSHLIGIALDGFPVYGGRDNKGNIVQVSQLDACNGITSATPELSLIHISSSLAGKSAHTTNETHACTRTYLSGWRCV